MTHHEIIPSLLVAGAIGCTVPPGAVTVTAAPAPVVAAGPMDVEVATPYFDVLTTPQVFYDGRPTYLYQDRWYYRGDNGRWRYYRNEPTQLQDRRRNYQFNRDHGTMQRGHEFDGQYRQRYSSPQQNRGPQDRYDRNRR